MEQAGSKAELSFANYIWVTQVNQKCKKRMRRFSEKHEKVE
jgi:hypothetical protein